MKNKNLHTGALLCLISFLSFYSTSTALAQGPWVKSVGGTLADYGHAIATDAEGNVYITGNFRGKADFDPGTGAYFLTSSCPCDESDPRKPDVFFAKYDKAGKFVWAKKVGGAGNDYGKGIAADAAGNVYLAGSFEAVADFDPGTGVSSLTSNGNTDIFLSKYNSNGELLWAHGMGGIIFDEANGLAITASGTVTITGSFAGAVDFDPSGNSLVLDAGNSSDPFFARYDASGNLLWARDITGSGESSAQAIFIDPSGTIYITGSFFGTSDFNPGTGNFFLTGADAKDAFFAKYTPSGNFIRAASIGGAGDQTGLGVTADNAGNMYATGYYIGTVDFNPGAGTYLLSSPGTFNAYLVKFSSAGAFEWVSNIGGALDDIGLSVTADAQQNVYATGYFSGTAEFDASTSLASTGSTDIYVAGYNTGGNLLFAKNAGGITDDWSNAIVMGSDGFAYITGYYTGTASFAAGGTSVTVTSAGNADVYFSKFKTLEKQYCVSAGADAGAEWIDLVALSDVINTSGNDGGYHDFTDKIATIAAGAFYDITLSAGFAATAVNEAWSVWIDWNKDGDFNDAGETVVRYKSASAGMEVHTFQVPSSASGATRMRVAMKRTAYSNPCDTFANGEVEDYTINVLPSSAMRDKISSNVIQQQASGVQVFPVPAKDILTVTTTGMSNRLSLKVYDANGKMVVSMPGITATQLPLDVRLLAKGWYVLKVTDDTGKIETLRWIKE